jgi:hypothetical protein
MNAHVHGVIFKDRADALVARQPEPAQKPRKPLGLAPVAEELSTVSALDGVSDDVLTSPATIADVLTALDTAIAIRSDIDIPLKVRLARLEAANGELRAELASARAETAELRDTLAHLRTVTSALRNLVGAQRKRKPKVEPQAEPKPELKVVA